MPENMATIVDWYGPYNSTTSTPAMVRAQAAAQKDYGRGLYVAIGHGKELRPGPLKLLYVGISENLGTRLGSGHSTLAGLSISSMWLGEIGTAGIPGRRLKRTDPHLDTVEWMTAHFLRVPHNERKTVNPPPLSAVVLNRWWGIDYETSMDRPVARWADVIEWNSTNGTANLCWFGSRAKVIALDGSGVKVRRPGPRAP